MSTRDAATPAAGRLLGGVLRARNRTQTWPAARRYVAAALLVALGTYVHLGIAGLPSQPPRVGFVFVAIVCAAAFLGRGPGLLAVALAVPLHLVVLRDPTTTGAATFVSFVVFVTLAWAMVQVVASLDDVRMRYQDADARWANLVAQLPDVVFRLDRDLRHVYVSPAITRFTSVPPDAFVGRTAREIGLAPDAAEAFEAAGRETLATDTGRMVEYRVGGRTFRSRLVPERDLHGRTRTILGITEDVTERKHAEAEREELLRATDLARRDAETALRDSARWDRVFQAAHFGLAYADATTSHFLAVNPAFARERGYAPEELVGQPFWMVYPPELHASIVAVVRSADASGHVTFESIHVRKDGSRFPVLVDLTVIKNDAGRPVSRVAHVIDLTRQKETEEARRQSEERFRTLADSIPQLAWMARPDGYVFWYNRRWYEYTGATPGAHEGTAWERVHDPAELPRVRVSWQAALTSGEPWEDTFPLRRHDGRYRPHLSRAMPVRDAEGRIVLWFGTNTDITEQKRAEERIQQLLHEAEERERRKDEFLAMLAHELRNPLAPIRNAAEIVRQVAPDDPRLARARELIDRQVVHMARLVDDLLDVSRITRGTITLRRGPVRLTSAVQDAVDAARPVIDEHRHALVVEEPAGEDLWVDGDHARLVQVFANLLTNAAKFTPDGGRIVIAERRTGERDAAVVVRDSGIGIPPAMQGRVFDLFAQGDAGLARARGGLGIGLTLVKRLVELHGGRVDVASGDGRAGAEFTVTLPILAREIRPDAAPGGRDVEAPRGPMRVLVVEDNDDAAESFRMVLELFGHDVRVAHLATDALALLDSFVPDVAFVDIGLPGMDGFELASRLRADPRTRQAFLVAVTGYGRDEDKARARRAGFDLHMTKPVDVDAVCAALARGTADRARDDGADRRVRDIA